LLKLSFPGRIPVLVYKKPFRIYGAHDRKRESIGQYLARAQISLQKIEYIKEKGKVILHTKYKVVVQKLKI